MIPDSSVPNTLSAWRRKERAHPPKKMGRLSARRVEGRRAVTSRLCLFSVSPPGSVSNCGSWREMRLCCQREAIYLTAPWKNKLTAGQAVTANICGVHCRRGAHCLCSWFSNGLSFSSFHRLVLFLSFFVFPFLPCCWMRSSSQSQSMRTNMRKVTSATSGDISVRS